VVVVVVVMVIMRRRRRKPLYSPYVHKSKVGLISVNNLVMISKMFCAVYL
jgi:hypothetical protein